MQVFVYNIRMNKAGLISKLRKEFPEVKFMRVKLVTMGWDHDVLVLDDKFIVRFAKARLSKNSFAREINFLKEFSKISNLKVPNYTLLSHDKSFGGYEMIKGRVLTPKMYHRLSLKKKQKVVQDLARFLNILHSIPLAKEETKRIGPLCPWNSYAPLCKLT